jgi:hypothetical protein
MPQYEDRYLIDEHGSVVSPLGIRRGESGSFRKVMMSFKDDRPGNPPQRARFSMSQGSDAGRSMFYRSSSGWLSFCGEK